MIIVTGARGFVGAAVCAALRARGDRLLTVGRGAGADVAWPAGDAEFGPGAMAAFAGARAAVHFAGESIGARWTADRKLEIMQSRSVNTTRLARAMARLDPKPLAFVSASAVGYYGSRGDEWLDESSPPGDDFLSQVTRAWEQATTPAREAGIRVVQLRLGVVLGSGGGMLDRIRLPFSLGLGGMLGSGQQWFSWIALADVVRIVLRAIDDASLAGAINAVSPAPVRNTEFTAAVGRVMGRPAVVPMPAFALRAMFGEMADGAMLASQRARPARLLAAGYAFEHPEIEDALRAAFTT